MTLSSDEKEQRSKPDRPEGIGSIDPCFRTVRVSRQREEHQIADTHDSGASIEDTTKAKHGSPQFDAIAHPLARTHGLMARLSGES